MKTFHLYMPFSLAAKGPTLSRCSAFFLFFGGTFKFCLCFRNDTFNYYSSRNTHDVTVVMSPCITRPPHGAVSLSPTLYINFTFNISRTIHQANWTIQQLFNQTKGCESSKTPGGGLVHVYKIEAWRFVTVGLLLQDNYPLK